MHSHHQEDSIDGCWLLGAVNSLPLLGLWEVENVTVHWPRHLELEQVVGETGVTHWKRVPLVGRLNLLAYMLGERYIRINPKFRTVRESELGEDKA